MLSLLALLFFQTQLSAKVLIATVAQVKNHVITSREVNIHAEVDRVLGRGFGKETEVTAEEQVIREWLLYFEASTFYSSPVSAAQVNQLYSKANQKLGASAKWQSLSVKSGELKQKITRRLEAERLYNFKRKASVLPVGLAEIETEYTQNRILYGNQSFDEVKASIRKSKVEANLKKRMEQWFQVLEQKYKVQRFSKFNGM